MFDDDKVSAVTSEDILKLSGGGKFVISLVCLNALPFSSSEFFASEHMLLMWHD
jgi:hypothetical protein